MREEAGKRARFTRERSPRPTVSVVVPTLNEEHNIAWVLERIPREVDEIIVVDGCSTDGTVAAALRTRPDLLIVHERARGKGAALRAGFAHATGDYVAMLDADGSMDPLEISRYVALLDEGFELVKGSRFLDSGGSTDISRVRMVGNKGLLSLANLLYRSRFTELCYGYMAFRREALPHLRLNAQGFEIETQIVTHALRAGLRIAEVPSFEAERRSGETNLRTFRDGRRVLSVLVRTRRTRWPEVVELLPATDPSHPVEAVAVVATPAENNAVA